MDKDWRNPWPLNPLCLPRLSHPRLWLPRLQRGLPGLHQQCWRRGSILQSCRQHAGDENILYYLLKYRPSPQMASCIISSLSSILIPQMASCKYYLLIIGHHPQMACGTAGIVGLFIYKVFSGNYSLIRSINCSITGMIFLCILFYNSF